MAQHQTRRASLDTIRNTVKRANALGLFITEYALRQWVRDGKIRVVYIGNRALVYYPSLEEFIRGADASGVTAQ